MHSATHIGRHKASTVPACLLCLVMLCAAHSMAGRPHRAHCLPPGPTLCALTWWRFMRSQVVSAAQSLSVCRCRRPCAIPAGRAGMVSASSLLLLPPAAAPGLAASAAVRPPACGACSWRCCRGGRGGKDGRSDAAVRGMSLQLNDSRCIDNTAKTGCCYCRLKRTTACNAGASGWGMPRPSRHGAASAASAALHPLLHMQASQH
jgi:hypothetical protein